MPLPVAEFVRRWKINSLSERAGAQSHFLDLCDMLGEPHPAASDPTGERYTFEKPVQKTSEGKGFADVWLRDHFAWPPAALTTFLRRIAALFNLWN